MACKDCNEKQKQQRGDRQRLDTKITATISEAITATAKAQPELSKRLMALNGELNALAVSEREELLPV